ncbi:MAG: HD domain-containing protein, partial [Spirochaetia bacterium]|nr:HD domain-containing protein [Spirochaetia bacterium]
LSEHMVQGIQLASIVHDLGKINIPADILNKPSSLSPEEFKLIQTHCQTGYDILKGIDFPWPIAQIVFQHHERLDGTGYPQGLKGDAILLEARIVAVADIVEAMTSPRPYRPTPGLENALLEIDSGRGTAYDAAVVEACTKLFRQRGFNFSQVV